MKSNSYTFRVIIEPDEPNGYHGFVPLLKGLHTQGETLKEVKANLREAIICYLQALEKDKEQIPLEGESFESIETILHEEIALAA